MADAILPGRNDGSRQRQCGAARFIGHVAPVTIARRLRDRPKHCADSRPARLLDSTLADLYGTETRALVQAVVRNMGRFPEDFCFRLDNKDVQNLRSQIVMSSSGWGGRRNAPYAFTEQFADLERRIEKRLVAQDHAINEIMAAIRQLMKPPEPARRPIGFVTSDVKSRR